nr:MAG TPA: hypothetical protein [Caudoviricetes sp.]
MKILSPLSSFNAHYLGQMEQNSQLIYLTCLNRGICAQKIFQQNILAFGMLLLLKEIVNMNAFSMTTLKRKRTEIYKF